MRAIDLLVKNAEQLIRFVPTNAKTGFQQWQLEVVPNSWLASAGERIVAVGSEAEVKTQIQITVETHVIDAQNCVVTPGLIDPHTHPVFYATREAEFELRIQGKSYEKIAAAGGGIRSSVRSVRQASKEVLKEKVRQRLQRFLALGTTTIEAKSGYGLSVADEVKSLAILVELNREQSLEIIPTFLGAHEVPDEYRHDRQAYIQLIIERMIPTVAEQGLAEFCDVFCEQGVFSLGETRQILAAAKENGLKIKLHADQLHLTGATQLAIEFGAVSADHLEQLDETGIAALARSKTVACLLPGSVFFLGVQKYPPARKLIDAGARVCLATDFNPGSSMTQSLPLMMTLACLKMKMTPAEALTAATIGAAAAIDREESLGNLQSGYQADWIVWNVDDYRQIPYYFGVNLTAVVVKKGKVVLMNSSQ